MSTVYKFTTDAEWHALRARHVGGSEVASLFEGILAKNGESPYQSKFTLWHIKAGNIEPDNINDNERVQAGKFLEDGIAKWVAHQRPEWTLTSPNGDYLSNGKGLGATPDFYVTCPVKGRGIAEVKNVDRLIYRDWANGKPPLKFQLQLLATMGLAGASWGVIVALVGGNSLHIFEYEFFPNRFAAIEKAVADFWGSVARGIAPDVQDSADIALYLSTMEVRGENIAVWGDGHKANALLTEYFTLKNDLEVKEERQKFIKKELADMMQKEAASSANTALASIRIQKTDDAPATIITKEMVGQSYGGRKGFTSLVIRQKKEKKND